MTTTASLRGASADSAHALCSGAWWWVSAVA